MTAFPQGVENVVFIIESESKLLLYVLLFFIRLFLTPDIGKYTHSSKINVSTFMNKVI